MFQIQASVHSLFELSTIIGFEMTKDIKDGLTFHESLVVSFLNDNRKTSNFIPAGGIVIDVETSTVNNVESFLVCVTSQLYINNQNGGSHIISLVDKHLHTLEENRLEYLNSQKGVLDEKSLYVAVQNDSYYTSYRSNIKNIQKKWYYNFKNTKDLICEGANVVLLRYLALTKFIGQFEMSCMYINGDLCRNIYSSTGPETGIVNNKKLDVIKINRIIIEQCGITHYSVTCLTLKGNIVKQEWESCDYVMHINPCAEVSNHGINYNIPLRETWEEDIELYSKYLDFKVCNISKKSKYADEHPELKNIIADYLQNLLLKKPNQILDFSINYFSTYAPLCLPHNKYYKDID